MTTTTPDMGLILPDVSVTAGPQWATLLNAALTSIDSHNHSTGQGVLITPSGLNISSDLSFVQNNATNMRTARLFNNSSLTPGVNDLTCMYAIANELYYRDGAGNVIQITSGGFLNLSANINTLSIKDTSFFIQNFSDTTKQVRFNVSAIPTATTRIMSIPDSGANDTLVTANAIQTLTQKTLTGNTAASLSNGSGNINFNSTGTITVPAVTDTLVGKATTDIMTNKSFNNTVTVLAANTLQFNNSGNTFSTSLKAGANAANATFALPIADGSGGQVMQTDGSGQLSFTTVATSAGNFQSATSSPQTYTNSSARSQYMNPTAARTDTLPTTSIVAGDTWVFTNSATTAANVVTLQSSGSNSVCIVPPAHSVTLVALVSSPTTAANWQIVKREGQWVQFTPVTANLGTVSNSVGFYKMVNDNVQVKLSLTSGTTSAAGPAVVQIPASLVINTSKCSITANTSPTIGDVIGHGISVTVQYVEICIAPGSSTTNMYVAGSSTIGPANALVASAQTLTIKAEIPVTL